MEWLVIIGAIIFLCWPTPQKLTFLKWFVITLAGCFLLFALIMIGLRP